MRHHRKLIVAAAAVAVIIARTTGSGDALVLRDGQAFQARWSRPAAGGGTTFRTVTGQPTTFAPGPVWIARRHRRRRDHPGPGELAQRRRGCG